MIPLGAHVTWILSWSGWQFPSSPTVQHVGQTGAIVMSASVVVVVADVDVVGAMVEVTAIVDVVLADGVVLVATDVVADVVVA